VVNLVLNYLFFLDKNTLNTVIFRSLFFCEKALNSPTNPTVASFVFSTFVSLILKNFFRSCLKISTESEDKCLFVKTMQILSDELDINDIPIAEITNEFLLYIKMMESLNIDLASEFILVAATLMRIKAKMLIPRKPVDEEGNEIDPREELVQRLMEYKRYKSVLEDMRKMEGDRSLRNIRGNTTKDLRKIGETAQLSTF